jgi:hypothetical protein
MENGVMRIRNTFIVLAGSLAMAGAWAASLKDKPPEGVKLSGSWKLDPSRSDDAAEAMRKAEKAEIAKRRRQIEERNDRDRDVYDDRPWHPDGRNDPRNRRRDPFPDRGDDGVTIDPNGEMDVTWGTARPRSASDEFLLALDPNPETLTIMDWGNRVSVSEDKLETDCFAGEVRPIADAFGDGDRQCGWRGRAWVIETKRVERFKRTDRFELSKDGKELRYTSTAAGANIPTIKVARTYTLVPATKPE